MSGEFFDELSIQNPFLRYINALWERFKYRQLLYVSEKIFPVSIFGKSQVLYELPGVDVNRLRVLYKPVDFEAIDRAEKGRLRKSLNIGENGKILLTATNFNYGRKYEALLFYQNIIFKALQENPDWVYVILGAGAGFEHFKNTVARDTSKTLQKRIFIMGFHSKVYEALSDADLFIYLSYRDAGPQVVKEAQASRLPVIANYSCFGSNEFIPNIHDGINLLFEDPKELSFLLEKLFSDYNLRNKLGIINRRHAEKLYQPEDAARKFLKEVVND
jgi:glycosyltransferase involved in cell wall biosynthesis